MSSRRREGNEELARVGVCCGGYAAALVAQAPKWHVCAWEQAPRLKAFSREREREAYTTIAGTRSPLINNKPRACLVVIVCLNKLPTSGPPPCELQLVLLLERHVLSITHEPITSIESHFTALSGTSRKITAKAPSRAACRQGRWALQEERCFSTRMRPGGTHEGICPGRTET